MPGFSVENEMNRFESDDLRPFNAALLPIVEEITDLMDDELGK